MKVKMIIISNTSESSRNDLKNIQKHQKGGLSGKPIEIKSNNLINKFYKLLNGKIKDYRCREVLTLGKQLMINFWLVLILFNFTLEWFLKVPILLVL
jgi:hypothetical protein